MKHLGRKLLLPVAAVALAGGSFAFLASNTVGASSAGEGTQTISGYTVSDISYTYYAPSQGTNTDGTDTIQSVSFTLDHAASQVSAVVHGDYDYAYNQCTANNNKDTKWTCVTGLGNGLNAAPVVLAKNVSVTAVQ